MHQLLTTMQMAAADLLTIEAGTPGIVLMERAGEAVARAAARLTGQTCSARAGRSACIICGPGNNGGDGFVAARHLMRRGWRVDLGLLGPVDALKGDAAEAARRFGAEIKRAAATSPAASDVVIDAMFGAGLSRDLDGEAARCAEIVNAAGRPVLAVDIASGVDGNDGRVHGCAVRATETVTFFRRKPGHILMPGRQYCGSVTVADIGIAASVLDPIGPEAFANDPALWRDALPVPLVDGHKYGRGHALVVSGGLAHAGAARLCASGALRAGAGLVTVASPGDALLVHAAQLTAIMLVRCDDCHVLAGVLADARKNAVVLGPGLGGGEGTRTLVSTALQPPDPPDGGRAVVLDADALTSFAGDAAILAGLIQAAPGPVVITPHAGEFARLFSRQSEIMEAGSKLARARAAARFLGATVIDKGPDTVVACPRARASIGCDLPPWLATAGSGDVLAGMVCGLLAQRMPPFEAASAAVWLHGAAARRFGPGLTSEDLPQTLPHVLRDLLQPGAVGPNSSV